MEADPDEAGTLAEARLVSEAAIAGPVSTEVVISDLLVPARSSSRVLSMVGRWIRSRLCGEGESGTIHPESR